MTWFTSLPARSGTSGKKIPMAAKVTIARLMGGFCEGQSRDMMASFEARSLAQRFVELVCFQLMPQIE